MPLPDPRTTPTLPLAEAAQILGVGRTVAYQSVQNGTWPTAVLHLGRRILIPTTQVLALLAVEPDRAEDISSTAARQELVASLDAAETALRRLIAAMAGVRSLI